MTSLDPFTHTHEHNAEQWLKRKNSIFSWNHYHHHFIICYHFSTTYSNDSFFTKETLYSEFCCCVCLQIIQSLIYCLDLQNGDTLTCTVPTIPFFGILFNNFSLSRSYVVILCVPFVTFAISEQWMRLLFSPSLPLSHSFTSCIRQATIKLKRASVFEMLTIGQSSVIELK